MDIKKPSILKWIIQFNCRDFWDSPYKITAGRLFPYGYYENISNFQEVINVGSYIRIQFDQL